MVGGNVKESRALQIKSRSGIDHHVIEVLAGYGEQFIDSVHSDPGRGEIPGAASTNNPEGCVASSEERKFAIYPAGILKSVVCGELSDDPEMIATSPSGRPRSINSVFSPDSWANNTAKIGGEGGDSTATFGAEKHE